MESEGKERVWEVWSRFWQQTAPELAEELVGSQQDTSTQWGWEGTTWAILRFNGPGSQLEFVTQPRDRMKAREGLNGITVSGTCLMLRIWVIWGVRGLGTEAVGHLSKAKS